MIFIAKGTTYLGCGDKPARFEADPNGGTIAIGILDDDTMQVDEDHIPELFGDFQPSMYLGYVYKLLQPCRGGDIPDFPSIIKKCVKDHHTEDCLFMEYCDRLNCRDCIVYEWINSEE